MSSGDEATGPAICIVAAVGLAYLVVILVQLPGASRRGDFSIYYGCAVAMQRGLDPYAIDLRNFTRALGFEPDPFVHPADTPTFTVVTMPIAMISPPVAYAMWFSAEVSCLIASLYLLFGALNNRFAILLSLGALGFTPLADNFRWAQSQIFVLLGILIFFRLMQRGRDGMAGMVLAMLGLLRGFPLVLGGYLIARQKRRAVVALALAFALGAAATVAAIGAAPAMNFLRVLGIIGGRQWFSLDPRWELAAANVSLDAFVARALMLLNLKLAARTTILALKLPLLAATFSLTTVRKASDEGALSLWIVTMLILTPVVWLHYLVVLLIPFGFIALGGRELRLAPYAYCIIVMITPLMSTLTFRGGAPALAQLGFLSLLFAWFATWRFASDSCAASEGAARYPAPLRSWP